MVSIYTFLYKSVIYHSKNLSYLKSLQLNKTEQDFVEEKANTLYSIVWLAVLLETIRRYTYTSDLKKKIDFQNEIENLKIGMSSSVGILSKTRQFQEKFINRLLRPLLCLEGYKISELDNNEHGKNSGVVSLLEDKSPDILNKKHPRYLVETFKDTDPQVKVLLYSGFNSKLYEETKAFFPVKKLNLEIKKVKALLSKHTEASFTTQRLFLLQKIVNDYFLPNLDYDSFANLIVYYALEEHKLIGVLKKNRRTKKQFLITIREFINLHSKNYQSIKTRYIIRSFYASLTKPKTQINRFRNLLIIHHKFNQIFFERDYLKIKGLLEANGYLLTTNEIRQYLSEIYLVSKKNNKKASLFD
jgi:hypothetical protein